MFQIIREDIQTIFLKDPAARNLLEVLLCYPGLHAIWLHRIANFFWMRGAFLIGRIISHVNRLITAIEIHPGAQIGRRFFIDHGMGIVIGETAIIGDDVLLYQGVVLGGTTLEKKKRHPTIGNNVVVGAGAILLGDIKIGDRVLIGAGSVVIHGAPPGATVIGVPGRIVEADKTTTFQDLEHGKLPDPILDAIRQIMSKQEMLETRINQLEKKEYSSDNNESTLIRRVSQGE